MNIDTGLNVSRSRLTACIVLASSGANIRVTLICFGLWFDLRLDQFSNGRPVLKLSLQARLQKYSLFLLAMRLWHCLHFPFGWGMFPSLLFSVSSFHPAIRAPLVRFRTTVLLLSVRTGYEFATDNTILFFTCAVLFVSPITCDHIVSSSSYIP